MYRMVRRYSDDEDEIQHIVNTGMLKVFQRLDSFGFRGSLEGWVRRLVFHALSDHYKKENRRVKFLDLEDRDRPNRSGVLQTLYFDDLMAFVQTLPDATQRVFHLYAIEGFTHAEIGEQLGISSGTSKWHLNNARKLLREKLTRTEYQNYGG